MALVIKGIDIILHQKEVVGVDAFNHEVVEYEDFVVSNVLVTPASTEDAIDILNLEGKRAEYSLCIPKGDEHNWTDAEVEFFGNRWKTIGVPKEYIESMVPLAWNKQIMVERYE